MDRRSASSENTLRGRLYVVATPIGNLKDISQRAIDVLQSVDGILAEDTRHSGLLLQALGIKKPLISLHAHNEHEKTASMMTLLEQGLSYALISDAGTPLISDPGFSLVREAKQHDITVIPIPGPCALITALSASGIPCDTFVFAGFLPAKQTARVQQLKTLRAQLQTLIFYESTHRIMACLEDIQTVYSDAYVFVLAKELTKIHENILQGTAIELQQWMLTEKNRTKGEFVLILPPDQALEAQPQQHTSDSELLSVLLKELPLKQAVKIASQLSSTSKNNLYELALTMAR